MAKTRGGKRSASLRYPQHWFKPEDLLTFVELPPFTRGWEGLDLSDMDLEAVQMVIMLCPTGAEVIEGTGGLRKLRFAAQNSNGGKSGGYRVCYAYFKDVGTVVLAIVYAKGEKDDLTAQEKKIIRDVLKRIEKSLLDRPYRCNKISHETP